jgi:hypothetical protein
MASGLHGSGRGRGDANEGNNFEVGSERLGEPAARVITYTTGHSITTPLIPGVSVSVEELLS